MEQNYEEIFREIIEAYCGLLDERDKTGVKINRDYLVFGDGTCYRLNKSTNAEKEARGSLPKFDFTNKQLMYTTVRKIMAMLHRIMTTESEEYKNSIDRADKLHYSIVRHMCKGFLVDLDNERKTAKMDKLKRRISDLEEDVGKLTTKLSKLK